MQRFGRWMVTITDYSGLGRDSKAFEKAYECIKLARELDKYIVIDADGITFICDNLNIIKGYDKVILTPNFNEFNRLKKYCNSFSAPDMSLELGVTIIQKNEVDVIAFGGETVTCDAVGAPRRCGGQGDILTGILATFLAWTDLSINSSSKTGHDHRKVSSDTTGHDHRIVCSYAACMMLRKVAELTFRTKGRSMLASDMIDFIHPAFLELDSLVLIRNNN
jgi:ATP-dependent NAD(P)H-hydrate dehydratase